MYVVKETFIASNGHVYNTGDELTSKDFEDLTPAERKKVRYQEEVDEDDEDDDFLSEDDLDDIDLD